MNEYLKNNPALFWIFFVLIFIICWPLGLYQLYRKLTYNKSSQEKKRLIRQFFGWVLILFSILLTIPVILGTNQFSDIIMKIIDLVFAISTIVGLLIAGLALLISANKKPVAKESMLGEQ